MFSSEVEPEHAIAADRGLTVVATRVLVLFIAIIAVLLAREDRAVATNSRTAQGGAVVVVAEITVVTKLEIGMLRWQVVANNTIATKAQPAAGAARVFGFLIAIVAGLDPQLNHPITAARRLAGVGTAIVGV